MSSLVKVVALDEKLKEAGNKLLQPPSSLDELLPLLDQVERYLSKVEQSPAKSTHTALSSLMKALVADELLTHPDIDVKVAAASCISEITRITAPEAPYDDDKMKVVFQLIVSAFKHLSDKSSRSYNKIVSILETVARIRSCVVMLDLECDDLILEMFQNFLRTIRGYHHEKIFSSMETIMSLVVDESEDISTELLNTLLTSVKKDNQEVSPTARRLVERVFEKSAAKLKPYLRQAIQSLNISLDDYSNILTSVSEVTAAHNHDNASREQMKSKEDVNLAHQEVVDPAATKSPKSIMSNDISMAKKEETSVEVECPEKEEHLDTDKTTTNEVIPKAGFDESGAVKSTISELKPEQSSGKKGTSTESSVPLCVDGEKEAEKLPENRVTDGKDSDSSHSDDTSPEEAKHLEEEKDVSDSGAHAGVNVASPSPSEGIANESSPGKGEHTMEKESLIQEEMPSHEVVAKEASERKSDSEEKLQRITVKKASPENTSEDKLSRGVNTSKNEDGTSVDAEANPQKQPGLEMDAGFCDEDDSSMKKKGDSEEHGPEEARHLEIVKDVGDSEAHEGANVAYPSPSEGIANGSPPDKGERPKKKESLIQETLPSHEVVTETASEAKPRRLTVKIASRETTNKDKRSSKVGTSKNEDSTTSVEAKPGMKISTSINNEEHSSMEKKEDAEERGPEEAKHLEKEKEIGKSEAHDGANSESPSPSEGIADENTPNKGESTKKKESLIQEEIPYSEVITKKSGRTNELEAEPQKRTNKASHETTSGKPSSEIGTSKNEDGTTIDAVAKPRKHPGKKMDRRVNDEDAFSMKKQEGAKERGPEEVTHVEKEKDVGDSEAHESANVASSSPSEGFANESTPNKDESPKKKASERTSDSEAKPQKRTVKFFVSAETTKKDKMSREVGTSKNEDGSTMNAEAKPRKQPGKKMDASVNEDDGSSLKKKEDAKECGPEEAKHLEKEKDISDSEAHEGEIVASPSPSEGSANGSPPSNVECPTKKESLIQEEVPRLKVVTQKASDRTSELEAKPQRRTAKKASRGTTSKKNKTSSKVGTSKNEEGATSDSEAKPKKHAGMKKVASVNKEERSSMKKKEDAEELGRGKASTEKQSMKSSSKDDTKEAVSSPKLRTKSVKEEDHEDEIRTKRKRTPSKEKASGTIKYGRNLVGLKVKVLWPDDDMFYEGVIESFDPAKKKHKVLYDDGDEETLDLRKERWEIVKDDSLPDAEAEADPASTDASSEMQKKKKARKSANLSAKHESEEVLPKRGSSASSSKFKGTSSKSGKKSKNAGKVDRESRDGTSESDYNSEDELDKVFRSARSITKSVKESSKSSGKSKDLDSNTSKSKSKQDTPKTASKSKEDTPKTASKSKDKTSQSGSKSSGTGTHKGKSSSSKGKDGGDVKEKLKDVSKTPEGTKRKLSDLSEERESTKGGKKRQRSVKD